jgi:hypothetical protein
VPGAPRLDEHACAIAWCEHDAIGSARRYSQQILARIAIVAVDIQRVVVEAQIGEVEYCRIDEVPVLHFVAAHHQAGPADAVDQKRDFSGGIVGKLRERLERSRGIGNRRLEDEYALRGGGNCRNAIDLSSDEQRAGHSTAHLDGRCPVQMGVIPVGAGRVIGAYPVFVPASLPRLNAELRVVHDVVAIDFGRDQPR